MEMKVDEKKSANIGCDGDVNSFFGMPLEAPKLKVPKPLSSCRPEFSLKAIDSEKVNELREWSREYFSNNLIYDTKDFQTLSQVRDS